MNTWPDDVALSVLNRPVWSALTGRQASIAIGDVRAALKMGADYGPFGASRLVTHAGLSALAQIGIKDDQMWLLEKGDIDFPTNVHVEHEASCLQMIATHVVPGKPVETEIMPLGQADAQEMLALAQLTQPGPFRLGTWRLGGFIGIRAGGKLVAMAGTRLRPGIFTEVSGVCTHPDFRGRGYAGFLMREVMARILARGEVPFLHSYADKAATIALYKTMGFKAHQLIKAIVLRAG